MTRVFQRALDNMKKDEDKGAHLAMRENDPIQTKRPKQNINNNNISPENGSISSQSTWTSTESVDCSNQFKQYSIASLIAQDNTTPSLENSLQRGSSLFGCKVCDIVLKPCQKVVPVYSELQQFPVLPIDKGFLQKTEMATWDRFYG